MKCNHCGETIPEGKQFCGNCGSRYTGSEAVSSVGPETLFFGPLQTPGRAKLIVIKGEGGDGVSYALNANDHVAGRTAGVILFPDDEFLSSEHASFHYRDDKLYLTDLGSLNGTYLRIRQPVPLADGEFFCCGQQVFRMDRLEEHSEYPTEDGTLLYVSPNRKYQLRVTQILEGGKLGQVQSSSMGELTIGREGCDLVVSDDPHLSRRHAKLSLELDGQVQLSDLGSKNGTFIRIKDEMHLVHSDYIFLGRELLRVEIIE